MPPRQALLLIMIGSFATGDAEAAHAQVTRESRVLEAVHDGPAGARPYRLVLPRGESDGPVPMLVLLHGCTQSAADIAAGTRGDAVAQEYGIAVLYPEQPKPYNATKCWNWFEAAHQGRDAGEPAILAGMVAVVAKTHRIDTERIYVAGISAGASMAAIMAATYPDLFAGLAVSAGLSYRSATNMAAALVALRQGGADPIAIAIGTHALHRAAGTARTLPVLILHGDADPVVQSANAEQMFSFWRTYNALVAGGPSEVAQDRFDEGGRTVRRAWTEVGPVELWVVEGLGHAWSGGAPDGSFTDPAGPDATRAILRFFLDSGDRHSGLRPQ